MPDNFGLHDLFPFITPYTPSSDSAHAVAAGTSANAAMYNAATNRQAAVMEERGKNKRFGEARQDELDQKKRDFLARAQPYLESGNIGYIRSMESEAAKLGITFHYRRDENGKIHVEIIEQDGRPPEQPVLTPKEKLLKEGEERLGPSPNKPGVSSAPLPGETPPAPATSATPAVDPSTRWNPETDQNKASPGWKPAGEEPQTNPLYEFLPEDSKPRFVEPPPHKALDDFGKQKEVDPGTGPYNLTYHRAIDLPGTQFLFEDAKAKDGAGKPAAQMSDQELEQFLKTDPRYRPWWDEFVKTYGGPPKVNDPDYDYRRAIDGGIVPSPYKNVTDGTTTYHWASALPDNTMLKGPKHPTAWMEYFGRMTGGQDPHAAGVENADQAMAYIWNMQQKRAALPPGVSSAPLPGEPMAGPMGQGEFSTTPGRPPGRMLSTHNMTQNAEENTQRIKDTFYGLLQNARPEDRQAVTQAMHAAMDSGAMSWKQAIAFGTDLLEKQLNRESAERRTQMGADMAARALAQREGMRDERTPSQIDSGIAAGARMARSHLAGQGMYKIRDNINSMTTVLEQIQGNSAEQRMALKLIVSMMEPGARLTDKDFEYGSRGWSLVERAKADLSKSLTGKLDDDTQRGLIELLLNKLNTDTGIFKRRASDISKFQFPKGSPMQIGWDQEVGTTLEEYYTPPGSSGNDARPRQRVAPRGKPARKASKADVDGILNKAGAK
jgi:hypothetical protein